MPKQTSGSAEAIARREPAGSLAEIPEYLRPKTGAVRLGNENVTSDDVIVPRISLCQANSFEKKKTNAKFIDGLEEGQFFNTATKEIYGASFDIINVHYFRSRIRWNGKEIGAGILCRSDNGAQGTGDPGGVCAHCEFSKFNQGEEDERPQCMMFMNFPGLVMPKSGIVDPANIVILSMKSLAIKAGKHWNTLVNIRNADRFAGIYRVTAVEDHRASGDSWQPSVENSPLQSGWVTQGQLQAAMVSYELINTWRAAGRMPAPESETVAV